MSKILTYINFIGNGIATAGMKIWKNIIEICYKLIKLIELRKMQMKFILVPSLPE